MMNTFFRNGKKLDTALNGFNAISASIYQSNKFIACGRFNS